MPTSGMSPSKSVGLNDKDGTMRGTLEYWTSYDTKGEMVEYSFNAKCIFAMG